MRASRGGLLLTAALLEACSLVGAPSPLTAPSGAAPAERPAQPLRGRAESPVVSPVRSFSEVRGLWVVRFTMTSRASVRNMVERAAASGFNTLIVQVRGRGDAFYRSRWEPRAEAVIEPPGFDPLALAIEEAHARGIAVHAWVNTHLVWDVGELPVSPEHVVNGHPEWLAVPVSLGRRLHGVDPWEPRYVQALLDHAEENSETVEGIYTSPSHPAVKERVYSIWMDLTERYDLDGLHFDYVRFPSADFDYSAGALRRFESWVAPRISPERLRALDDAARADPYAFVEALPGPWDEFRRAQIDGLVERVYHGVKARQPEIVVSAAVVADAADAYSHRFQDWPRWLKEGILDVAVPMAYTADSGTFLEQVRTARGAAGSRERVWAGIGVYQNTFRGTLEKIEIARREGAGGVVLFSYDWAVSEGPAEGAVPFLERVGRATFGR